MITKKQLKKILQETFTSQDVEDAIAKTGRTMQPQQLVVMLKQMLSNIGQASAVSPGALQGLARRAAIAPTPETPEAPGVSGPLDSPGSIDAWLKSKEQMGQRPPPTGGGAGFVEPEPEISYSPEPEPIVPPGPSTPASRASFTQQHAVDRSQAGQAPPIQFPADQPVPPRSPEQQASDSELEKQMQDPQKLQYAPGTQRTGFMPSLKSMFGK